MSALRSLQNIQQVATLAITDVLTTLTDLPDAHAGLLPMELALSKACHRAAVRLLTLPHTHPLHRITKNARCRPPKRHLGLVDLAIATLNIRNIKIETITPITDKPLQQPHFKTEILASHQEKCFSPQDAF